MIEVHLDGKRLELEEGTTLADIVPEREPDCCVAVIRPSKAESAETRNIRITTTAGEVVVELGEGASPSFIEQLFSLDTKRLNIGWTDRYSAAFGPFPSAFTPEKLPVRYQKDEVVLGCGGYDPRRSFLIFSKRPHSADHGAAAGGGVVGKVVSGHSVCDHWGPNDAIETVERVISWADRSRSFTTTDGGLVLEDGMRVVSEVIALAEGYKEDAVDISGAVSVEHALRSLQDGYFYVGRSGSTFIQDVKMKGIDVPLEVKKSRLEGTITVRTEGKARGSVYIYTQDIAGSAAHSVVGVVEHGIELVKLATDHDMFTIRMRPEKFDLLGMPLGEAKRIAEQRGVALTIDEDEESRIVIGQEPFTTLEVLAAGKASLATVSSEKVVDIRLYDDLAPKTCGIFRDITGLKMHDVGSMPLFFHYEDVYLFKPKIRTDTKINLENLPSGEVPANTLAMTNDSRKSSGIVGVRTSMNAEFGPTSEPMEGTNVIGTVLNSEKLEQMQEGEDIYIREVKE